MMSSLCKEVKVHLTDFINRFHFCNNSHSNMTPLPPTCGVIRFSLTKILMKKEFTQPPGQMLFRTTSLQTNIGISDYYSRY